jgi:hypothetical protein
MSTIQLICGPCCLEENMEKHERIQIALSRIAGIKYICPKCDREHQIRTPRNIESKPFDQDLPF